MAGNAAENRESSFSLRRFSIIKTLENVPASDAAVILEIGGVGDAERASELLDQVDRSVPVWIYHPAASVGSSVAWMKSGAAHVLCSNDELETAMEANLEDSAVSERASEFPNPPMAGSSTMIGGSRVMRDVESAIQMVANRNCSVLIEGETGTGRK